MTSTDHTVIDITYLVQHLEESAQKGDLKLTSVHMEYHI
jgi:hypothetical protein